MEVLPEKHERRFQEVMTKFDTFEQGKSRSVVGLEKQLAATIAACRTGGLDKIQYYSGHALQLLRFSLPPPGGTRVRLASPSLIALLHTWFVQPGSQLYSTLHGAGGGGLLVKMRVSLESTSLVPPPRLSWMDEPHDA